MTTDWTATALWNALTQSNGPAAPAVKSFLTLEMPRIQDVLRHGGTSPTDFTLHDADHSFRVAQRMAEIVPADLIGRLSVYELVLLLLSAYLHDIGMTPEQRKVRLHWQFLLTGERGSLPDAEGDAFQRWLDDQSREIAIPLSSEPPSPEVLALAGELTTHYCRSRHNDWSEDWIRAKLGPKSLGTYAGWVDDLVQLCRSHHYGYAELVQPSFNPRRVGAPSETVHLRYLACVLRVADVLDFDPERTPEVILRHREIAPASLIFWWKDKELSVYKDPEAKRYVVWARPRTARIHRAAQLTVAGLEHELRLCRQLADETHFEKCPFLIEPLPHRWDLQASVHADIISKDGVYEYIDGSFRPDTERVLQLLGAIELYRDPIVAVRELLQNAFDAVREQIAYQRLKQPDPGRPELEDQLARLHRVELSFETRGGVHSLVCTDTGSGMSKRIIRDHLLVSGTARRHDILALDRRCKEAGFLLGRSGQFGIGVLSYFMLAGQVIIQTRRTQDAEDAEPTGWCFETEGVGSFGALKLDTSRSGGTEVRLRLRSDQVPDPQSFCKRLSDYLAAILVRIPCTFRFRAPGLDPLSFDPGWVPCRDRLFDRAAQKESESATPPALLSAADRQAFEQETEQWRTLVSAARARLRWRTTEGELPSGLGRYRIDLPYFELPGGVSLACIPVTTSGSKLLVASPQVINPRFPHRCAWRGMLTGVHDPFGSSAVVQVDLADRRIGQPSVSRNDLVLTAAGDDALQWLRSQAEAFARKFVAEHSRSRFSLLSCSALGIEAPKNAPLEWVWRDPDGTLCWDALRLPAIAGELALPSMFGWQGRRLAFPVELRHLRLSNALAPDRILQMAGWPVAIWSTVRRTTEHRHLPTALFPPRWWRLCSVQYRYNAPRLWNEAHPLVTAADAASLDWIESIGGQAPDFDALQHRQDLLSSGPRAAALLVTLIDQDRTQLWRGLVDRASDFVRQLWALLFGSEERYHCLLTWSSFSFYKLAVDGWTTHRANDPAIEDLLPDPGPDWTVQRVEARPARRKRQPIRPTPSAGPSRGSRPG